MSLSGSLQPCGAAARAPGRPSGAPAAGRTAAGGDPSAQPLTRPAALSRRACALRHRPRLPAGAPRCAAQDTLAPSGARVSPSPATPSAAASSPFGLAVLSTTPLPGGATLTVCTLPLALAGRPVSQRLRVLTPAACAAAAAPPPGGWPVLYLNDGQNLFGGTPGGPASSWAAAEAHAAALASSSGDVPPFLLVGVDHHGPLRSLDYVPLVPGTGKGGFRPEAADWPGGGCLQYLDALADTVLPAVQAAFSASGDPRRVGFGGSSFGGLCALHAMATGHRLARAGFARALVESPSLWVDEGRYLQRVLLPAAVAAAAAAGGGAGGGGAAAAAAPAWPARLYLATGGREHTGTRYPAAKAGAATAAAGVGAAAAAAAQPPPAAAAIDTAVHVASFAQLAAALTAPGGPYGGGAGGGGAAAAAAQPGSRALRLLLDPPGGHSERDWARRLPAALRFVMADGGGGGGDGASEEEPQQAAWAAAAFAAVRAAAPPPPPTPTPPTPREAGLASAAAAAARPPDPAAAARCASLFYTAPPELVAGAPFALFVNRRRLAAGLAQDPNLRAHYGFDGWAGGGAAVRLALAPAPGLPVTGDADWWWAAAPACPPHAAELNFALTDADGRQWDNNSGSDYAVPVVCPAQAAPAHSAAATAAAAPPRPLRAVKREETISLAGGRLVVLTLHPRGAGGAGGGGGDGAPEALSAAEQRSARWQEERTLRVFLPAEVDPDRPPPGGWPVLYMSDAQNLFDDGLAHQGVSWRCAECVAHLLPPFIVVGIDAAGAFRSLNYLPWPPGSGAGGFRPDCARWPGGGVEGYLRRVISDVAPLAQARFGASALRERCVFGGASFAGVAALHAALAHPDVFGGALVESPSLWAAEGAYLGTMRAHGGPVAERVWLGSGTREFSATREHEENGVRPHVDWLLQDYHAQAASVLADKGCTDGRLRYQLDEGAGHHEGAWAWRLHAALLHLFHGRM